MKKEGGNEVKEEKEEKHKEKTKEKQKQEACDVCDGKVEDNPARE
jgi:hypothetical protein